jgi:hypothetical protein
MKLSPICEMTMEVLLLLFEPSNQARVTTSVVQRFSSTRASGDTGTRWSFG